MRNAMIVTMAASLAASGCGGPAEGVDEGDPDLGLRGGYRTADDPCRWTSETAFTADFLDDAADLVACPTGDPAAESLAAQEGARLVTQTTSFSLYSVPRR